MESYNRSLSEILKIAMNFDAADIQEEYLQETRPGHSLKREGSGELKQLPRLMIVFLRQERR
jgi:hypothetical protein